MSRFLFTAWLSETHLTPQLEVASRLRDSGHDVAFYAGRSLAGPIENLGFPIFPFESLSEEVAERYLEPILEGRDGPRKLADHLLGLFVSQIREQVDDLSRILDSWHADVIVSDMTMVASFAILLELRSVQVAVLSHVAYCMVPGVEGPIPGRAMPPRTSALSRAKAALLMRGSKFVTRKFPPAIDRMRQRYGLAPLGLRITDYYARIPLLMIPTAPELDYMRSDLTPNVHYIGNCAWPPIDKPQVRKGTRKVLIEEGKLHSYEPTLLKRGIEALAGSEFEVLVVAGSERDNVSGLVSPAKNIRVTSWMPLRDSLQGVDLMVTNANSEPLISALSLGIPVIAVPEILDQAEMGLRVQTTGVGIMMSRKAFTPLELLTNVRTVMSDSKYGAKAGAASAWLGRYQGPADAVHLLERLAKPVESVKQVPAYLY